MDPDKSKICVVGAGVIGLTTAVNILQTIPNVKVTVLADKFSPDTTSDVAAGLWKPHAIGNTSEDLQRKWGKTTMDYFKGLCKSEDAVEAGVHTVSGYMLFKDAKNMPNKIPFWKDIVFGFREVTESELDLFPGHSKGWFFSSTVTESKRFLPWLLKRFIRLGGQTRVMKLSNIDQVPNGFDVVVNCSGIGAHDLISDRSVQPLRGQVVRVEAPWVKHFVIQQDGDFQVLICGHDVVMGGVHEDGNWSTEIDRQQAEHIIKGCCNLIPSLKFAKHIYSASGLRPVRQSVRLEREDYKTRSKTVKVVHNYGHGGSGITMSWGCAVDAALLVKDCLYESSLNAKL